MKKYLLAVAALALASGARAEVQGSPWLELRGNDWLLMKFDWVNSEGFYANYGTPDKGALPMFNSRPECQRALRRAVQADAGKSHAEGGMGSFLCVPSNAFTVAPPPS